MGQKSHFTTEQDEYIIEKYGVIPTRDIAKTLGFEGQTKKISNRAASLGITRDSNDRWMNEDSQINKDLLKRDEPYKDFIFEIKEKGLNTDFFKVIDTEPKAYWLGFLIADGYVYTDTRGGAGRSKRVELGLGEKDRYQIEKFKRDLNIHNVTSKKKIKLKGKEHYAYITRVYSSELVGHLEDKGCIQNKSLVAEFPSTEIVPKEMQRHFMRGYFDGDGGVYSYDYSGNMNYSAGLVGTEHILLGFQKILNEEADLGITKITHKGKAFQIKYAGKLTMMKLYEFLYKDNSICLERKRNVFLDIFKSFN